MATAFLKSTVPYDDAVPCASIAVQTYKLLVPFFLGEKLKISVWSESTSFLGRLNGAGQIRMQLV